MMKNMKSIFLSTLVLTLLTSWLTGLCLAQSNQVANLGAGTVVLLAGYKHQALRGTDSIPGTITGPNGKFIIHYDIGPMAGAQMGPSRKKECSWYREQLINGCKACLGITTTKGVRSMTVTIYESAAISRISPANFYAKIQKPEDLADMLLILSTFKFNLRHRKP